MPEDNRIDEAGSLIRKTNEDAEALKRRLEAGEDIDEKELVALARKLATQIETARAMLEEAVGPIDPEVMRAEMKSRLSPEEFAEWEATEAERRAFREEVKKERSVADQLGDDEGANG
jgi:hypothetical protein